MEETTLSEDDISGEALKNKEPKGLTNEQLKCWLKCRGVMSSR